MVFTIFTFTSLPLKFYISSPDVVVVSDLNKNISGSTDVAKKIGKDQRICIPLFKPLSKQRHAADAEGGKKCSREGWFWFYF